MVANCYQGGASFPLFSILTALEPLRSSPVVDLYQSRGVDGIDTVKIAYFAASVIWRAGATKWRNKWSPRLELARYEELLRQYLMGETGFPKDIALRVILPTPKGAKLIAGLPMADHFDGMRAYTFFIPGVTFTTILGSQLPARLRSVTFVPSNDGVIGVSDAIYREWYRGIAGVVYDAEPKGYLSAGNPRRR